ncbi:hypothetical protein [Aliamphritea hakodatensis]|uniref:hypothetical protein n=1 Tax=Aliamphritea hakodatensis TaxID=2895352 RepID=UPI0022FD691E|nr:hypothetical protein [Aliamphritea hakodatensis]
MSFDGLEERATQTGFARLVGVSQQAISGRVKDGRLREGASFADWLLTYCEELREQAAGRGGDQQADFQKSRAADMAASAALKQIQYHEKIGTLIHREEARMFLGDWSRYARREFENAFNGLFQAIEERTGEAVPVELKEKYAGAANKRIGDFARKLGGSSGGGGDSV